jgi:hypothetical protein
VHYGKWGGVENREVEETNSVIHFMCVEYVNAAEILQSDGSVGRREFKSNWKD